MNSHRKRFLTAVLLASTGCSAFQPYTQRVTINATDPEAEIAVDDAPVGKGHAEVDLMRNQSHIVTAVHYGRTGTVLIDKHISPPGVLDIIGGCFFLVPFVGCFTPGFWDLSTLNVTVRVPESSASR